jgi:glutathione synthase/RimK-type ligase-like ATP-grasp enzyme
MSWWRDERLCIERYILNKESLFFRVYILLDKLVVSSLMSDQLVKRPDTGLPRRNFLFSRRATLEGPRSRLPAELLHSVSVFQKALRLDYGAIDLVMDDSGHVYIVDVNPTPFWGTENQPEVTAHLSEALAS